MVYELVEHFHRCCTSTAAATISLPIYGGHHTLLGAGRTYQVRRWCVNWWSTTTSATFYPFITMGSSLQMGAGLTYQVMKCWQCMNWWSTTTAATISVTIMLGSSLPSYWVQAGLIG